MDQSSEQDVSKKVVAVAEAVYRVSGARGFDSALAVELRKRSLEIMSAVASMHMHADHKLRLERNNLLAGVAGIQSLIRFAGARGYISEENSERIVRGYKRVQELLPDLILRSGALGKTEPQGDDSVDIPPAELDETITQHSFPTTNERRQRIIDYLSRNKRGQLSDIRKAVDSAISEKTLQRDLNYLTDSGVLGRIGDNRWTTYFCNTDDPNLALSKNANRQGSDVR